MSDSGTSEKKPIEEIQALRARKPKLERVSSKVTEHKRVEDVPAVVVVATEEIIRKTGISILGALPWGTHLCQFYQTKEDLIDILVPYFKAGLENNEFCMWVTSEPLSAEDAKRALKRAVMNLDDYIKKGQIEILDYSHWYTKSGMFEADKALQGWVEKHEQAVKRGFDGLRLTGNTFWLEKEDWVRFTEYEAVINKTIGKYKMFTICTYCLDKCRASEIIDVMRNHQFVLIKQDGTWKIIESYERELAEEMLQKAYDELETQVKERTAELTRVNKELQADIVERKRAEEALRETEEKYRTLTEHSRTGIFVNQDGRYAFVNDRFAEIHGYSPEELLGKEYQTLVHPDERKRVEEIRLKRLERKDVAQWYEVRRLKKSGQVIWCEVMVSRIEYMGKPATMGNIIDITERKRAEKTLRESEKRFRQFFENEPEYCYMISPEGVILDVNSAALKALGYKKQELVGKPLKTIYAPESLTKVKQLFPKWQKTGQLKDEEMVIITKEGSRRTVLLSAETVKNEDGRILHSVSVQKDVTERKQAEQKLLEYQAQLKSLASQLSLAEEHERRRIAVELHDQISQSLCISKLKLETLRESAPSAELGKALDEVCNSLGRTIANTRSLTFDLSSPILYELGFEEAVAEWLTEQIEEKHGIATEFEDDGQPRPLDDDIRILLFRDVRELLINVVKHAQAHKVKVSIRTVGSRIRVGVEDDGVGFDPAGVVTMAAETNGFGLFSVRERLEQIGGHLEIESAPGHGSRITMTAPLKGRKNTERR